MKMAMKVNTLKIPKGIIMYYCDYRYDCFLVYISGPTNPSNTSDGDTHNYVGMTRISLHNRMLAHL